MEVSAAPLDLLPTPHKVFILASLLALIKPFTALSITVSYLNSSLSGAQEPRLLLRSRSEETEHLPIAMGGGLWIQKTFCIGLSTFIYIPSWAHYTHIQLFEQPSL